ncbi:hypothetical protein, partial [Rhodococcus sp. (in: high G+C Gram-positive bacteria)]
ADARKAVQDGASPAEVQPLTSELQQLLYGLVPDQSDDGQAGGADAASSDDDDVIDAEFDRS